MLFEIYYWKHPACAKGTISHYIQCTLAKGIRKCFVTLSHFAFLTVKKKKIRAWAFLSWGRKGDGRGNWGIESRYIELTFVKSS